MNWTEHWFAHFFKWKVVVVWHQQANRAHGHQAYFQFNFEMCFCMQYKMSESFCPCYLDCDLSKGCLMLMLNIISFHLGISYSFTWFSVRSILLLSHLHFIMSDSIHLCLTKYSNINSLWDDGDGDMNTIKCYQVFIKIKWPNIIW